MKTTPVKNRFWLFQAFFALVLTFGSNVQAAGSLDMQIERTILKALKDYNTAMNSDDVSKWIKYFEKNAVRSDPLSSPAEGIDNITKYYQQEFSHFSANINVKKVMLKQRTGAVEMIWIAKDKKTSKTLSVPMTGIFELAPSGKFQTATFYFDTSMNDDEQQKFLLDQLTIK